MSDELERKNEDDLEATPIPHTWWGIFIGGGAFIVLLGITILLITQHIKTRPFDMVHISEQTAQSIEIFLRDHQIAPEQILAAPPLSVKSPTAHYVHHGYTVHLSPGMDAATIERQLGKKMFENRLAVRDSTESSSGREIAITYADFTMATVEFIETGGVGMNVVAPSRSTSTLGGDERRLVLPKLNPKAFTPRKGSPATLPKTTPSKDAGWRPPTPQSRSIVREDVPTDTGDDMQLVRRPDAVDAIVKPLLAPEVAKPLGGKRAKLVIIVDDGGWTDSSETLVSLSSQLTLSILPHTPFGTQMAEAGHNQGFEIMLHMPMENNNEESIFQGQLNTSMSGAEMGTLTREALAQVPHASGINNHTGSKFTADAKAMALFIHSIMDTDLFFVDSKTAENTRAYAIAQAFGIPSAQLDLFLDNPQESEAEQVQEIRKRFEQVIQLALAEGEAVAICHFRPTTLTLLAEMLPTLESKGIELVHASELVQ